MCLINLIVIRVLSESITFTLVSKAPVAILGKFTDIYVK